MAFVECLGVSQEDTREPPLWRETLDRSPGSYGAAKFVGGMCHATVGWRLLTLQSILINKPKFLKAIHHTEK